MKANLAVNIGRLKLKNPVMVASGTFGYAEEFKDFLDLKKLGALVSKTITLKPRSGNPPPRTCETPSGMLNSIGLENPGLEKFASDKLPLLAKFGPPVIVSIASEGDPKEFTALARRLDRLKAVAAIELNISCPNIRHAGRMAQGAALISQDAKATYDVVRAVRRVTDKTIITKLSPNVTDIVEIALAAQRGGCDAIALINTLYGMSIDVERRRPKLAMVVGGLSGPAIRPVALRMVWQVRQKISIPIIGMGGIIDPTSALEFFLAGASAVAVGTGNFVNPGLSVEIIQGIRSYMVKYKAGSLKKIIGGLKYEA